MSQDEFLAKIIGARWERWAESFDACDCYGLLILYYRNVLGVELGSVPHETLADGIAKTDLFAGWRELESPINHACGFMSFRGLEPTHCGIYIGRGQVLHSSGSDEVPGGVRVSRVKSMELAYGKIHYYAHHLQ